MKYYIITEKDKIEFANYAQLVNYLIHNKQAPRRPSKLPHSNDPLVDRIQITGKDTRSAVVDITYPFHGNLKNLPYYTYGQVLRDVCVIDEFGNNAFNFQLIHDVEKYSFRSDIEQEHRKFVNRNKKKMSYRSGCSLVEFRKDPVPYTAKWHHRRYFRCPHTTQEKKFACDPEYRDFFRKGHVCDLPSAWDDIDIQSNRDISWKSCTKNRHQWENRVKCRSKHMDVYTPVESCFTEVEDEL